MHLDWEKNILRIIADFGDTMDLQQIYRKIPEYLNLSEDHLRQTQWGDRPAFQHIVRSCVSNLLQRGSLIKVARGKYRIPSGVNK